MNRFHDPDGERRQRWLHPRHLPYVWVLMISVLLMPAVVLAVLLLFALLRLGRWGGHDKT
ncbi:hypothetical protein [uncultured Ferrimonas sp.]|uniref:hypothetical protein n=1 Tax=uncultured Ferrimonas sp. TaxID=432640 RepID=UPI00260C2EE4|nr:hypothetical protein [uncultured Ferrimonas sp.]